MHTSSYFIFVSIHPVAELESSTYHVYWNLKLHACFFMSIFAIDLWSPNRTMNRPWRQMARQMMRRPSNCQDSEPTEGGMKKR